jgi:hypothetical protein
MPTSDQHVVRLDVPMHHAMRMGILERVQDLLQDSEGVPHWELVFPSQFRPERLSLDIGHDIEEEVLRGSGGEEGNDVGVLEPSGELDLTLEPISVDSCCHLGGKNLDHDIAP